MSLPTAPPASPPLARAGLVVVATLALALAATTARADGVRHVPPAEALADQPLRLRAEVARASERTLLLRYRPLGATSWSQVEFARGAEAWIATVPPTEVAAPGVEYFIVSAEGGADTAEFASAEAPHRVGVYADARTLRRNRDLAHAGQRRSRARVAGQYVSYGRRAAGSNDIADHYYRVDADFAYRLLAYPLEEIRFGYTRLEGYVPQSFRAPPPACDSAPESADCRVYAGFKVGGWFELGLGLTEGVRLDLRGIVVANQVSAAPGGRAELRVGALDGNHVALGVEVISDVGGSGFFRLGWDTVPRLPMAATVEITDFPASTRATGVRLIYDLFVPLPDGLRAGVRVGYAARDEKIGGLTTGLSASLDF
ncbi:MAG: hypothetical protein HS111_35210 [Kofleriaceae bacterium]|nr:hypothetical protein [Kofleriaceae bacterium]MCL4224752.1 hypothetical protein [Myxococcales bacterium]